VSRRVARPARIADLLPAWFERAGIGERIAQASVVAEWPQLVGERIAAAAHAESVRDDGVLLVQVTTASWAQELSLMTPQIIARINAGRGGGRITGIYWRVQR
jgi:predicted nucleic acid-binding Zn ribbon protein